MTVLNLVAVARAPVGLRTEAAVLFSLFRNTGASLMIAIFTAILARNIQVNHALLFETQHVKFQFRASNFLALQFDHTADTMLGINDIIADDEAQRLGSHLADLSLGCRKGPVDYALPRGDRRQS